MQRSAYLLQRWMALDRNLHRHGLQLSEFAECWMVDRKTIRRDLAAFRRLGYPAECKAVRPGKVYLWGYPHGQRPMFTASLA
jgi:predicted DNA-binding transcriptional regulator YafY